MLVEVLAFCPRDGYSVLHAFFCPFTQIILSRIILFLFYVIRFSFSVVINWAYLVRLRCVGSYAILLNDQVVKYTLPWNWIGRCTSQNNWHTITYGASIIALTEQKCILINRRYRQRGLLSFHSTIYVCSPCLPCANINNNGTLSQVPEIEVFCAGYSDISVRDFRGPANVKVHKMQWKVYSKTANNRRGCRSCQRFSENS